MQPGLNVKRKIEKQSTKSRQLICLFDSSEDLTHLHYFLYSVNHNDDIPSEESPTK